MAITPLIGDPVPAINIVGYPGNAQEVKLSFPAAAPPVTAVTYYAGTNTPLPSIQQPTVVVSGQTATITYPMPANQLSWTGQHEIKWAGAVQINGTISCNRTVRSGLTQTQTVTVGTQAPQEITIAVGESTQYALTVAAEAKEIAEGAGAEAAAILTDQFKGPWVAGTYAKGDQVTSGGNTYRRKADGTDMVFNAAQWDITAVGGTVADGAVDIAKLGSDVIAELGKIDSLTAATIGTLIQPLNAPLPVARYNSTEAMAAPPITQTGNPDRSISITGPTDNLNDTYLTYLDTGIGDALSFVRIKLVATIGAIKSTNPCIGLGFLSGGFDAGFVVRTNGFANSALKGALVTQHLGSNATTSFTTADVVTVELIISGGSVSGRMAKNGVYGATYVLTPVADANSPVKLLFRGSLDFTATITSEQSTVIAQKISQAKAEAISYTDAQLQPVNSLLGNSPQLIPDNSFVADNYYSRTTGGRITLTGWKRTDFIPVLPNTTYTVSGIDTRFVGNEYSTAAVGSFIGNLSADNDVTRFTKLTFTTGPNTFFVGININSPGAADKAATAQLELGTKATSRQPYGGKVILKVPASSIEGAIPDVVYQEQVTVLNQQIATNQTAALAYTDNKLTPINALLINASQMIPATGFVVGNYYSRTTGGRITATGWIRTDFIAVLPNTTYTISGIETRFVGNEYGSASTGSFIRNLSTDNDTQRFTSITFTTSATTNFIGINITSPNAADKTATCKLEQGSVATGYEAFGAKSVDGSRVKGVPAANIVGTLLGVVYQANAAKNYPVTFVSYNPTGYSTRQLFLVYVKLAPDSDYYVRYQIGHVFGVRQDMYRIVGADLYRYVVDSAFVGTMVDQGKNLLTNGENEMVYKQTGKTDFTGGVHGDEVMTDVRFLLDEIPLSTAELAAAFTLKPGKKFEYIQKSGMYEVDNSTDVLQAEHLKVTTFVEGGYNTRNKLTWKLGGINIAVWYCGICCIAPAQAEVLYTEDADFVTLGRAGGETEFLNKAGVKEIHYNSSTNKLGAFVSSSVVKPTGLDDTAILSYKDNATYAKYYRRLENRVSVLNEVYEGTMIVRHYLRTS